MWAQCQTTEYLKALGNSGSHFKSHVSILSNSATTFSVFLEENKKQTSSKLRIGCCCVCCLGGGSKTGRLEKVAPVREEGTAVLLYLPSHWRVKILDLVVDHLLGLIAIPTNPGEHHLLLISVACVPPWMCEVVILKETGQRNRSVVQSRHGSVCAFTKGNQGIVYWSVLCSARACVCSWKGKAGWTFVRRRNFWFSSAASLE